jgi:manganese/iron transport system permease protein/iron/zinc/copper transport system permease protein
MQTLAEPLTFEFFRNALMISVLAGALCGLVGTYVVLRGMSYIGHGLSHAVFGGAAAAAALAIDPLLGAAVLGFVTAILIQGVSRRRTIGADAAIGVITSAMFAVGIAIMSVADGFSVNFDALLFGNVLGVSAADVAVIAVVTMVTGLAIFLRYRPLLFTTFDPEVAEVSGVNTRMMDAMMAVILAATITASMNVVGVTLIAAVLVIPPVVGRLLTDSFHRMLWISVATGGACGFVGVYLSYYLNWSSGATVVITAAIVFGVAFVLSSIRHRTGVAAAGVDVH